MKNVKWLLIFLLVCTLTSFGSKDSPVEGLRVGDIAPNFMLKAAQANNKLSSMKKNNNLILLSYIIHEINLNQKLLELLVLI